MSFIFSSFRLIAKEKFPYFYVNISLETIAKSREKN